VLLATSGSDNPSYAAFKGTSVSPSNQLGAAASFYPYRVAVMADSPFRYWRLGETSGPTAADASGGNRPGTYVGTYALNQASALRWDRGQTAASFTVGGVTANSNQAAPGTWSLEAFVKTTSTAGGRILGFGTGSGGSASGTSDRHLYLTPSGNIALGILQSTSTKFAVTSPGTYRDGAWHHVVGTHNPTTGQPTTGLRLYVDGNLVASQASTSALTPYTAFLRAGAESLSGWPGNPTSAYLSGQLDELAMYPTALTAAQVSAHYDAATGP
jgi:hypothetical protein